MSEPLEQPVPASFDPTKPAHVRAVAKKVAETNGEGWEPRTFDAERRKLIFVRANAVDTIGQETRSATRSGVKVHLAPGTTIAHGQRKSDEFEEAHKSKGFVMTKFEPYRGYALLEKLTPEEIHARAAVAGALRVKPWEVYVQTSNDDGGYTMILPSSYSPAKHEKALVEAVEVKIGKHGWYYTVKPLPQKGADGKDTIVYEARIVPSTPPTFEPIYPYPFSESDRDTFKIPVGVALGEPGVPNSPLVMNLSDNAGCLLQGLAGAGKSVLVNALVYGVLAAGHEIAIIDVPHKAADFDWVKPYVRENGWGCESKADAVTVAALVYEEGQRRGELLRKYGVQKWQDLPEKEKRAHPIIDVVVDELTGLLTVDPEPKSLPKDHPVRVAARQEAAERDLLRTTLTKIPAEMRAAGIRLISATQQAQSNTGIPPTMKINLPNRMILGAGATKQQRNHALSSPDAAPIIPEWIAEDDQVSKGVGVAEFEGSPSAVFKAYYASTSTYLSAIDTIGCKKASRPEPTAEQVARLVPQIDDDLPGERPASALDAGGFGGPDGRDVAAADRLTGAARAAHDHALQMAQARRAG